MVSIRKIIDRKVLVITFVLVFIIHGEILFNKLAWHDEVAYIFNGWGEGLMHGRWLVHYLSILIKAVSGLESLPVAIGIIVAICIGGIACLLFDLFKIKQEGVKISLILIFVSIPSIAGHFGYMGSAGIDFIGKFICVLAAYIVCKNGKEEININRILLFLVGCFCFACALGEYQCYVALYLSILVCYFTMEIMSEKVSWKEFWLKAVYYVGSSIIGLVMYLVILKICLGIEGVTLTSYAGTDSFGVVEISEYIQRILFAYSDFFDTSPHEVYSMFPFHWKGWYGSVLFCLLGLMFFVLILKANAKRYRSLIQCMIIFPLFILAINFNFVVYGASPVHSLHMYHYILIFLYLFILLDTVKVYLTELKINDLFKDTLRKGCSVFVMMVVVSIGALYIRYDNSCYMFNIIRQENAISYYTTLITRIQSLEGYSDDMSIATINELNKRNDIDVIPGYYDPIVTNPYSTTVINSYTWKRYVQRWCGFNPIWVDGTEYENDENVMGMPHYPNDGSIRIIDDVIVVKF